MDESMVPAAVIILAAFSVLMLGFFVVYAVAFYRIKAPLVGGIPAKVLSKTPWGDRQVVLFETPAGRIKTVTDGMTAADLLVDDQGHLHYARMPLYNMFCGFQSSRGQNRVIRVSSAHTISLLVTIICTLLLFLMLAGVLLWVLIASRAA